MPPAPAGRSVLAAGSSARRSVPPASPRAGRRPAQRGPAVPRDQRDAVARQQRFLDHPEVVNPLHHAPPDAGCRGHPLQHVIHREAAAHADPAFVSQLVERCLAATRPAATSGHPRPTSSYVVPSHEGAAAVSTVISSSHPYNLTGRATQWCRSKLRVIRAVSTSLRVTHGLCALGDDKYCYRINRREPAAPAASTQK